MTKERKTTKRHVIATALAFTSSLVAIAAESNDSISDILPEIVVTGTREITNSNLLPVTISTIGNEKLNENHRPNILETVMEQVPSMMVTSRGVLGYGVSNGGSGGMMLRGISSSAGQVMVLVDGHPQYNGIYGHSIADSYHTMLGQRVEVLRGPASMLYGSNAMGGVVNIITTPLTQDTVQTSINLGIGNYGTVQVDASNMLKHNKTTSMVGAQYARTDNHRPHMGFEQYTGFAKVKYDLNNKWNIFANADLTHFNASQPGTTDAPMNEADQYITRGVVSAGLENRYEKTNGRLSIYDNFGRHKINDGYDAKTGAPQKRLFRSKDALLGINWFQNLNLFKGNHITLGVDYQNIYGRAYYTNRETGEVMETQNKQSAHVHNDEIAEYIDIRQDLFKWLSVDFGVRYDHHTVTGGEWVPQGGIAIRPMKEGVAKLMVSKGFRNPTMKEMYLYPPSNLELEAEEMMNYEFAWKHTFWSNPHKIWYGFNLFYIEADNMIQTINKKNVNTGEIENKGVEVEFGMNITDKWSINTNHSWLDMKNPVVGAPTYKGYLGTQYSISRFRVLAGIQDVHGLYKSVGKNEEKENFLLLNATINYKATKNDMLNIWAKADNILGQEYEINAGYPMPKTTFMIGASFKF